jgi:hypothetical protein
MFLFCCCMCGLSRHTYNECLVFFGKLGATLGKALNTLGKGFAECHARQRAHGKKTIWKAAFAECLLSGTRQAKAIFWNFASSKNRTYDLSHTCKLLYIPFRFPKYYTKSCVNWLFDALNEFKSKRCQLQSFITFRDLQFSFKFLHTRSFEKFKF